MLERKLKDNSGTTILIALLFFVLCAVVGSIILASATSASGRVAGLKTQEQSYYSVTSAAKLIRDEINQEEYTHIVEKTINGTETNTTESSIISNKGTFNILLKSMCDEVMKGQTSGNITREFTIAPSSNELKDSMGTVLCSFNMISNGDNRFSLYININQENGNDAYNCTLLIPAENLPIKAKRDEKQQAGVSTTIDTTTVRWSYGNIAKGITTY